MAREICMVILDYRIRFWTSQELCSLCECLGSIHCWLKMNIDNDTVSSYTNTQNLCSSIVNKII